MIAQPPERDPRQPRSAERQNSKLRGRKQQVRRPCDSASCDSREAEKRKRETLGVQSGFPWLSRTVHPFPGGSFLASCCCYPRCSSSFCYPQGAGAVPTIPPGSLWTPGRFRPGSMKPSLGFSSTGVFFPCQASAASGFGEVPLCQLCHTFSLTSPPCFITRLGYLQLAVCDFSLLGRRP